MNGDWLGGRHLVLITFFFSHFEFESSLDKEFEHFWEFSLFRAFHEICENPGGP